MHSNLRCYQLQIYCYIYRMLYPNLTVTTKQKSMVNTQTVRKQSKKRRKEPQNSQNTINKIAISIYLSIVTLYVRYPVQDSDVERP